MSLTRSYKEGDGIEWLGIYADIMWGLALKKIGLGVKGPFRKHSWGSGGFSVFATVIWMSPSEDWQNLDAQLHFMLNNTTICVPWPYLSYLTCLDN